mmetsp:Transcript_109169/g.307841  ORF Transcript_109169/g.307841 Transcript_109169/m.307841 type:complete len:204 (+) Transcript_109169:172-783(+)
MQHGDQIVEHDEQMKRAIFLMWRKPLCNVTGDGPMKEMFEVLEQAERLLNHNVTARAFRAWRVRRCNHVDGHFDTSAAKQPQKVDESRADAPCLRALHARDVREDQVQKTRNEFADHLGHRPDAEQLADFGARSDRLVITRRIRHISRLRRLEVTCAAKRSASAGNCLQQRTDDAHEFGRCRHHQSVRLDAAPNLIENTLPAK